jgi:hypothetical protein
MLKNIYRLLNQYILAALIALCVIYTLLFLWCPPRSKLDLASAEALVLLLMNEGNKRGRLMYMQ